MIDLLKLSTEEYGLEEKFVEFGLVFTSPATHNLIKAS